MTQSKQQDKIKEIMRAVLYYNGATTWGTTEQMIAARAAIESKLRELVREPLSVDDANKLWDDCLKKYKRPGPYELIAEFCNITSTRK